METILERIGQADDAQLTQVIRAVIRRYREVYPTEEIIFLSVPTEDQEERRRVLEYVRRMLEE